MNYAQISDLLGDKQTKRVKNNTYLRRIAPDTIVLELHGNRILQWNANGETIVKSCGWETPTTKSRLNEYGPVQIFQQDFTWYFNDWFTAGVQRNFGAGVKVTGNTIQAI